MTDGATDKDFHSDKESVIQETQQALICIHQVAEFKRTDRREARRVLLGCFVPLMEPNTDANYSLLSTHHHYFPESPSCDLATPS